MNWIRRHLNWKVGIGTALVAIGVAGGTALAAPNGSDPNSAGGGPAGAMPPPPMIGFGLGGPGKAAGGGKLSDQFASELAGHLDGVSADEVSKALEQVAADHEQERRAAMAKALSAQLDGVSEQDVSAALEQADQKMRDALDSGKPPAPGTFEKTLADELGVSEDDVTAAMRAAAEKAFTGGGAAHAGLPGPPPMPFGGMPPMSDGGPGGFATPQSSGSGSGN